MKNDFMQFTSFEEIFNGIENNIAIGIGIFDGIHLGHRAIVSKIIEYSREEKASPVILTFDPHPKHFFSKDSNLLLLQSNDLKIAKFKELGIKCVVTLPFNEELAHLSHIEFLKKLTYKGNIKAICVGENWRFGSRAIGDSEYLDSMQKEYGYKFFPIKQVSVSNKIVSSTIIRRLFSESLFKEAYEMIGLDYRMEGIFETSFNGEKCRILYGIVPHILGEYRVSISFNDISCNCSAIIDKESLKENSFNVRNLEYNMLRNFLGNRVMISWSYS